MSQPLIFISTNRLKEGQREAYQQWLADFIPFCEEREPDLQAFYVYFDDDGEHVTGVQVHANPQSMLTHMAVTREHISAGYADYLEETESIQVFGEPTDEMLAMMEQIASTGTPISINRPHNGFNRFPRTTPSR